MPLVQGTGYRVIRSSDDSKVIQTLNVQPKWKLFVKWLSGLRFYGPISPGIVKLYKCLDNTRKRSKRKSLEARPAHTPPVVGLGHQNLGVSVHTGNQTQTDRPSDGLGHLALVAWTQASVLVVLDLAHVCHVLGHDAEVLCNHRQYCSTRSRWLPSPPAYNFPQHTL